MVRVVAVTDSIMVVVVAVRVPMGSPTSCCQIPEMVRACVSEPDSQRAVNAEETREHDVAE